MIGYAIVDLTLSVPCRWDEKDHTLYTSSRATVFQKKGQAKRAVASALVWWRLFSRENGVRNHSDNKYLIVPLVPRKETP